MSEFVFQATSRTEKGTSISKRLRKNGKIPAVLYGKNQEPLNLELNHNDFINQIENQDAFTSVVTLKVDDKDTAVVIKDLQRHPYANKILHIDFQKIDNTRLITKKVPIETVGVSASPGVRLGALLTLLQADIEIRCLPEKLPKKIQIDCSKMQASSTLKMSELKVPEGVEIVPLLRGGKEYDHAVVLVGKAR